MAARRFHSSFPISSFSTNFRSPFPLLSVNCSDSDREKTCLKALPFHAFEYRQTWSRIMCMQCRILELLCGTKRSGFDSFLFQVLCWGHVTYNTLASCNGASFFRNLNISCAIYFLPILRYINSPCVFSALCLDATNAIFHIRHVPLLQLDIVCAD